MGEPINKTWGRHFTFSRVFLILVSAWTLPAIAFVIVNGSWGAIGVAGILSAIVNGSAAAIGSVYVIVRSIWDKRFHWWALVVAIGAPLVSAVALLVVLFW